MFLYLNLINTTQQYNLQEYNLQHISSLFEKKLNLFRYLVKQRQYPGIVIHFFYSFHPSLELCVVLAFFIYFQVNLSKLKRQIIYTNKIRQILTKSTVSNKRIQDLWMKNAIWYDLSNPNIPIYRLFSTSVCPDLLIPWSFDRITYILHIQHCCMKVGVIGYYFL